MKFYIWGGILFVVGVLMLIGVAMSIPSPQDDSHPNGTMPKAIAGRRGPSDTNSANTSTTRPNQNQQNQMQNQNRTSATTFQPTLPPPAAPLPPPAVPPMPDLSQQSPTGAANGHAMPR